MWKASRTLFLAGLAALFAVALPVTPSHAAPLPSASIAAQGSGEHPRAHHRKGHPGGKHAKRRIHRRHPGSNT